jgi:GMP synthase (glutamine-hydrolysing)
MTRYLVVQHEPEAPAGWLGERWSQQGIELDVVRPDLGEALPEALAHDALIVLGGAMNANEDGRYPWLAPTRELIREAVADGIPTLGVCLGHQLVSVALGGEVIVNPKGRLVPCHSALLASPTHCWPGCRAARSCTTTVTS